MLVKTQCHGKIKKELTDSSSHLPPLSCRSGHLYTHCSSNLRVQLHFQWHRIQVWESPNRRHIQGLQYRILLNYMIIMI